jgi:hypothetical protein
VHSCRHEGFHRGADKRERRDALQRELDHAGKILRLLHRSNAGGGDAPQGDDLVANQARMSEGCGRLVKKPPGHRESTEPFHTITTLRVLHHGRIFQRERLVEGGNDSVSVHGSPPFLHHFALAVPHMMCQKEPNRTESKNAYCSCVLTLVS